MGLLCLPSREAESSVERLTPHQLLENFERKMVIRALSPIDPAYRLPLREHGILADAWYSFSHQGLLLFRPDPALFVAHDAIGLLAADLGSRLTFKPYAYAFRREGSIAAGYLHLKEPAVIPNDAAGNVLPCRCEQYSEHHFLKLPDVYALSDPLFRSMLSMADYSSRSSLPGDARLLAADAARFARLLLQGSLD